MLDASASRESAINPEKNAFPQVIGGLGSLGERRKDEERTSELKRPHPSNGACYFGGMDGWEADDLGEGGA
jgi:hypothetical protein